MTSSNKLVNPMRVNLSVLAPFGKVHDDYMGFEFNDIMNADELVAAARQITAFSRLNRWLRADFMLKYIEMMSGNGIDGNEREDLAALLGLSSKQVVNNELTTARSWPHHERVKWMSFNEHQAITYTRTLRRCDYVDVINDRAADNKNVIDSAVAFERALRLATVDWLRSQIKNGAPGYDVSTVRYSFLSQKIKRVKQLIEDYELPSVLFNYLKDPNIEHVIEGADVIATPESQHVDLTDESRLNDNQRKTLDYALAAARQAIVRHMLQHGVERFKFQPSIVPIDDGG